MFFNRGEGGGSALIGSQETERCGRGAGGGGSRLNLPLHLGGQDTYLSS